MLRKATSLLAMALLGLAVVTPLLAALRLPLLVFAVRQFFAVVCHEIPERSFSIAGQPIAICVRCFGIYCGATLGPFMRLPRRPAVRMLVIALFLNAVDVASETSRLHDNFPALRLTLGLLLGLAAAAAICAERHHDHQTITA